MELLISVIVPLAFLFALINRMEEKEREQRKWQRILNRTNNSAWNRAKKK